MIFHKKADETVTSLSIFVDNNIQKVYKVGEEPQLETEIFRAIYLIIYMLACKQSLFRTWEQTDEFAVFGAKMVYMRLINPKQWTPDAKGKKLEPIKSVLNYINISMNGMKNHYQNENFHLVLDPEVDPRVNTQAITAKIHNDIQQDYNFGKDEAILNTFAELPKVIKKVIKETPFKHNRKIRKNLYMSVLLTTLSNVTLPRVVLNKLDKAKDNNSASSIAYRTFQKNYYDEVILWHLDKSFSGYVDLLTRKSKLKFSEELSATSSSFDLDENILDAIMSTAFDNAYNTDLED